MIARWQSLFCVFGAISFLPCPAAWAGDWDLSQAFPSFAHKNGRAVPIDFQYVDLRLRFDVSSRRATGVVRINFYAAEAGFPVLDSVANATRLMLNDKTLSPSAFALVAAPGDGTRLRVLEEAVTAGSTNLLEIEYEVPSSQITFSSAGARIGFFMDDVGSDRGFLEQYVPSNLEFDQYQMEVEIKLVGATSAHRLFANGRVVSFEKDVWRVMYPSYFTTSSFYLHLTDKNFSVATGEYVGLIATVPITVYSDQASLASSGLSRSKTVLKELESTYGPFAHDTLTVYVTPNGGGMEHCGATMTSLDALDHELTHSWFARGVMPANGNAGWIDEAMASWRDNGYPRASSGPSGNSVNMGSLGTFRRATPVAAYTFGAKFMSQLDRLFPGGLKPVMRELFLEKRYQTVTTEAFETFLEQATKTDLTSVFSKFVHGKARAEFRLPVLGAEWEMPEVHSSHPRPFTQAERAALR